MPKFFGSLHGLRLKGNPKKTMDAALKILIREAAREWLRAVVLQVPVWSGQALGSIKFARGTNGNLSRYLNVSIPIVPVKARPNKNQYSNPGKYNFPTAQNRYRFSFRSDVIYYIHNEFFPRTDPGAGGQQIEAPWHSLEAGKEAFQAVIAAAKKKLPRLQKAIESYSIPFGL